MLYPFFLLLLFLSISGFGLIFFFLFLRYWHTQSMSRRKGKSVSTDNVSPWLSKSGLEMASALRSGEISSEELVNLHIQQIKESQKVTNAMVWERFDAALEEAKQCDIVLKKCREDSTLGTILTLPPFFGVPFTSKECFAFAGKPQTSGVIHRKSFIASETAPSVDFLRTHGGAILLAGTNVSELCMWMETANTLFGTTKNPYDSHRIVGGSSGGEASLISSCGSPFGMASDIGGSIRMPAFFCGIFGLKPTPGLITNVGQYPISSTPLLCSGPLARRSEDLFPLYRLLKHHSRSFAEKNEDGIEEELEKTMEHSEKMDKLYDSLDLSELIVFSVPSIEIFGCQPSSDLLDCQEMVEQFLKDKGAAIVDDLSIPHLSDSLGMWSTLMADSGAPHFAVLMGNVNPIYELLKWTIGRSHHTLPAIGLALIETVFRFPFFDKEKDRLRSKASELRKFFRSLLGPGTVGIPTPTPSSSSSSSTSEEKGSVSVKKHKILLFPSHTRTAPPHSRPIFYPIQWCYTALFNLAQLPVTQVPLGLDREGLPMGIQVVAGPGCDAITMKVAFELEKEFGGWTPSKGTLNTMRKTEQVVKKKNE